METKEEFLQFFFFICIAIHFFRSFEFGSEKYYLKGANSLNMRSVLPYVNFQWKISTNENITTNTRCKCGCMSVFALKKDIFFILIAYRAVNFFFLHCYVPLPIKYMAERTWKQTKKKNTMSDPSFGLVDCTTWMLFFYLILSLKMREQIFVYFMRFTISIHIYIYNFEYGIFGFHFHFSFFFYFLCFSGHFQCRSISTSILFRFVRSIS